MYKGSAIDKLSFKRKANAVLSYVVLTATFSAVIASPLFARILF